MLLSVIVALLKWVRQESQETLTRPDPFQTNQLRLFSVTWNLAGKAPKQADVCNLLQAEDSHHDIYAIGSQEALSSIMGSVFKPSKALMNQMV